MERLENVTQIFKSNIAALQGDDNALQRGLCCLSTFLLPNIHGCAVIVRRGKWKY